MAKVFDRLGNQFTEATIEDAVLLVEVSDPGHTYTDESGATKRETIVLAESTSTRVTIQEGILAFSSRNLYGVAEDDD